jgi:hypothetical protein
MIFPSTSSAGSSTSSVPVGTMATTGRLWTLNSLCPAFSRAPMSTGLTRWPEGTTSSVCTMSSPIGRTCCQGEAGLMIS